MPIRPETTFTIRGPLFDGRARGAVRDFLEEAKEDVANEGVRDVRAATAVFKNPTGYYTSRLQTDRQLNDVLVDDSDVVYGPWLEGTSSRNARTRFKGYRIWRLTTQRLDGKAARIAERVLQVYLRRMN